MIVLAAYIAWVWVKPRVIGRDGWKVSLPGGPLTLVQILIGILDLAFCAAAMYMLVPDEPHLGFIPVAVIFVTATLLGFASHAPGGLGVFDATMMVALWQFDKEDLLAGLLLFRLALLHHPVRAFAVDPRNTRGVTRPSSATRCAPARKTAD